MPIKSAGRVLSFFCISYSIALASFYRCSTFISALQWLFTSLIASSWHISFGFASVMRKNKVILPLSPDSIVSTVLSDWSIHYWLFFPVHKNSISSQCKIHLNKSLNKVYICKEEKGAHFISRLRGRGGGIWLPGGLHPCLDLG